MPRFNFIESVPLSEIHDYTHAHFDFGDSVCYQPINSDREFAWLNEHADQELIDRISQYCNIVFLPFSKGCIISSTDDINIAIVTTVPEYLDPIKIFYDILDTIIYTLNTHFSLDLRRDINDIINNTGKIAGAEFAILHGHFHFGISISLTDHKTTIDKIGLPYDEKKKPSFIIIDSEIAKQLIVDSLNIIFDTLGDDHNDS